MVTSAGDVERLITRQLATSKLKNVSFVIRKGIGHLVAQRRLPRSQTYLNQSFNFPVPTIQPTAAAASSQPIEPANSEAPTVQPTPDQLTPP